MSAPRTRLLAHIDLPLITILNICSSRCMTRLPFPASQLSPKKYVHLQLIGLILYIKVSTILQRKVSLFVSPVKFKVATIYIYHSRQYLN